MRIGQGGGLPGFLAKSRAGLLFPPAEAPTRQVVQRPGIAYRRAGKRVVHVQLQELVSMSSDPLEWHSDPHRGRLHLTIQIA